jgi:purine-binding chemotaxis protein CheW
MTHDHDDRLANSPGDEPGADEFAFEPPDLATAFLAALDAIDDRRFVTPPPPEPELPPQSHPEPEPAPIANTLTPGSLEMPIEAWTEEPAVAEAYAADVASVPLEVESLEAGSMELLDTEVPQSSGLSDEAELEALMTSVYGVGAPMPEIEVEGEADAAAPVSEEVEIDLDAAYEAAMRAAAEYEIDRDEDTPEAEAAAEAVVEEEQPFDLQAEAEADAALEIAASDIEIEAPADLEIPASFGDSTDAFATDAFAEMEGNAAAQVEAAEATADAIAEAMADAEGEPEELEDFEEFVAFSLGDTRCVIPIRNVVEIGRIPDAVPVPNAPAWLHGLGNLRGQVLSLIDLRAFLGIGRVRPATGRMLVLRDEEEQVMAGLLVDHVHQIVSLSASRFHAMPETMPQHYVKHAWGVCEYGNFTMIGLDVDQLLGVEDMENLTNEAATTEAV